MNILHISTFDTGGAGSFSVQMNDIFRNFGYHSQLVVRYANTTNTNIIPIDFIPLEGSPDFIIKKTKRFLYKRMKGISRKKIQTHFDYYFFQDEKDEYFSAAKILKNVTLKPDVIFLYWISEFITAKTINELYELTGARIYWLMIDNAPITGGCHYPWNCIGYRADCTNCPAIIKKNQIIKAEENLALKQKLLPLNLTIIAFSEQDYQRAKSSMLGRTRTVIKRLGVVDESKFRPGDKALAKAYFGIDDKKKVIFFGASKINEKRKGMDLLVAAFQQLADYFTENQVVLLYAGYQMEDVPYLPLKNAGLLDEKELILAYQASELFVCPSVEDSGPIMINQSIMCGTPVVAFESGVALDLVLTGITGYRATYRDILDLTKGLKSILSLEQVAYEELSNNCRNLGLKSYSIGATLKQFEEVIQ